MQNAQLLFGLLVALFVSFPVVGQGHESLKIDWPDEYKWKVGSNQEDQSVHFVELIPESETLENWTIMGNMMSIKGAANVPMDLAMNMMFDQAKKAAPKAKLTLIEKDDAARNPWVLFKIEAPGFTNDKRPESQLYYIVQGNTSLYSNFVAVKNKQIAKDFETSWVKVFKASELVYQ